MRQFLPPFGALLGSAAVREGGAGARVEDQIELTAESLWGEVSRRLRSALNDTTYGTWFANTAGVAVDESRFVLAVPNDFTRDWIEGHFLELIGAAIRDVTGRDRAIDLRVTDPGAQPAEPSASPAPRVAPVERLVSHRPESGGFNAKYTFDSFVIGSSHRFAHA